jgi:hypothetical protein
MVVVSSPSPRPQPRVAVRLIGVYHADGGLKGEVVYLAGKLTGSAHCALCDITHGTVAVTGKKAWKRYCGGLPVPFDLVHLNERDTTLHALTDGRTPCVLAETRQGDLVSLLGPGDLETCAGSVEGFAEVLAQAIEHEDLELRPVPHQV